MPILISQRRLSQLTLLAACAFVARADARAVENWPQFRGPTGQGHSVLEMIHAFEKASGRAVPYVITGRRPGDIAASVADPFRAADRMGWRPEKGLQEMCDDAWAWQRGRNA